VVGSFFCFVLREWVGVWFGVLDGALGGGAILGFSVCVMSAIPGNELSLTSLVTNVRWTSVAVAVLQSSR
jgi:hypothetical protein